VAARSRNYRPVARAATISARRAGSVSTGSRRSGEGGGDRHRRRRIDEEMAARIDCIVVVRSSSPSLPLLLRFLTRGVLEERAQLRSWLHRHDRSIFDLDRIGQLSIEAIPLLRRGSNRTRQYCTPKRIID
jgi:hypothetical protein